MKTPNKATLWSPDRPVKPSTDPLYEQIKELMAGDTRSTWAKANVSGLSTTTLTNWQRGKVKRPQGVSLQMAARMLGYEIVLKKGGR